MLNLILKVSKSIFFIFISIDRSFASIVNAINIPSLILLGKYGHINSYIPYSCNFELPKNADIIHYERPASEISLELVMNRLAKKSVFE